MNASKRKMLRILSTSTLLLTPAGSALFATCLAIAVSATPLLGQPVSHEEEVVRSTYGALSLLCSLASVTDNGAARGVIKPEVVPQTIPTFEISQVQVGSIASIANQLWNTRFTAPELGKKVLVGHDKQISFGGSDGKHAEWRVVNIHWEADPSWDAERIDMMKHLSLTVGEQVKLASANWTGHPTTYTRYATFKVLILFQGKTMGPYTASFLFGKDDATGKNVVTPQDAIVSQQLMWEALPPAYPGELIRNPELHKIYLGLDHWIEENLANDSTTCSSARSDLCCQKEVCLLPGKAVAEDLAVSAH